MNKDYISQAPKDVLTIIFNFLDQPSQDKCLFVNKKISNFASLALLAQQGLTPTSTSYSQLMKFRREYCNFFLKKITTLSTCRAATVSETKQNVDKSLSLQVESKTNKTSETKSLLDESWSRFLIKLAPFCTNFTPFELKFDDKFNDNEVLQPNSEALMYLHAGATEAKLVCVFEIIMRQKWSTEETVQTLIKHKYKVDDRTLMTASKREEFKKYIPVLIKNCETDSISFGNFFSFMPSEYEQVLEEEYVDKYRNQKVSELDILYGIQNKYSEKILTKLLKNCEKVNDYSVRLAIEGNYSKFSENFISELLNKCPAVLEEYHISQAIGNYSFDLIKKIYSKVDPQKTCKFSADMVRYVMDEYIRKSQKYNEKFIEFLVSKVDQKEMTECIQSIIRYGAPDPYEPIIEKYLPKASATFGRYIFSLLISKGFSENLILKLYALAVPEAINAITIKDLLLAVQDGNLDGVMKLYSSKIINLFLQKDEEYKEIDPSCIPIALDQKYAEEVFAKLVDLIPSVRLQDVKRAKQMSYSQELIQKMEFKCKDKESCVVQ